MKKYSKFTIASLIGIFLLFNNVFYLASGDNVTDIEQISDDEIKIIHLTDAHVGGKGANERFRDVLQHVNSLNPDIIIISGDFVDWGCLGIPTFPFFRYGIPLRTGEKNYQDFNKLIEQNLDENIQILICPGNHEYMVGEKTFGGLRWHWHDRTIDHWETRPLRPVFRYEIIWSLQNYHKYITQNNRYGNYPDNYNITYENTFFISLDSGPISINPIFKEDIIYFLSHWEQIFQDSWEGWCDKYICSTGLDDYQINMLDSWLSISQATNKIVFMHHPAIDLHQKISNNREEFIQICEENNVNVVLTGHMHQSHIYDSLYNTTKDYEYSSESENGLLCNKTYFVQTDDCGGQDTGYRLITVNGGNVTIYRTENVNDLVNVYVDGPANIDLYDSKDNHVGFNSRGKPESKILGTTIGHDRYKGDYISTYYGKDDYKLIITGRNKGLITITLRIKLKNGETKELIYDNIPVTINSKAMIDIPSQMVDYTLQMDNNNLQPTQIITK